MTEYLIASDTDEDIYGATGALGIKVNEAIADGWSPLGGVSTTATVYVDGEFPRSWYTASQAMVRETRKER